MRSNLDRVKPNTIKLYLFSLGIPVSSTNKTDRHDIAEILLKVVLNTINQIKNQRLYGYLLLFRKLYAALKSKRTDLLTESE
jgi:hypothetical protein